MGKPILFAFAVTRLALLLIGFAARAIPVNPGYPASDVRERGWQFTHWHALDMWARYDSGWFMSIVYDGYWRGLDINQQYSNVAFFPLFPLLVKALLALVPTAWLTPATQPLAFVVAGLVVANGMLLASLLLLQKLVLAMGGNVATALRAVWLLLLTPFGFFFSCAYSESTFLCLALACLRMAQRVRWGWAGVFGALAALARPPGILILLPCLLMWFQHQRALAKPQLVSITPLLIIPLAWVGFLAYLYPRTGQLLSPYTAHNAWQEFYTPPWFTITGFFQTRYLLEPIDRAMLLLTLLAGVMLLRNHQWRALGLYTLLIAVAPLWSGTLISIGRYCVIAFPLAVWLAGKLQPRSALGAVCTTFGICQAILFVSWVRFYEVM
jgi:hypothetical protein